MGWLIAAAALWLTSVRGLDLVYEGIEDVSTGDSLSWLVRKDLWQSALNLMDLYPLTGIGFGAFRTVSPRFESGYVVDKIGAHAHNDWLELVSEMGIPLGLAFWAVCLFLGGATALRLYRNRDVLLKWTGTGALVGFVNGLNVTYLRIPALIATLAMMSVTRGVAFLISGGRNIAPVPSIYVDIQALRIFGVPAVIIFTRFWPGSP